MKVLVTGSSGLVGSALVSTLAAAGANVIRLVRSCGAPSPNELCWDPQRGTLDQAVFSGTDAVVHLAGENIAAGRWTKARKARIRDSRVEGTRTLCEALAATGKPPGVLVCASAVGFYGHRGDDVLDEQSTAGTGFLPDVCRAWERATTPAAEKDIRVVRLRIGMVLSSAGGALAKMLPPFRMGLGGVLGSGRQYMSWIALDDLVGAIQHCLTADALAGPVNAVAPHPVTNREFTKTLGRILRRPTIFPVPAFAARLVFGEMASDLLLASTRAIPRRLEQAAYTFHYPRIEAALRHVLRA